MVEFLAGAMVLRLATEQHSHGADASFHFRVLDTVAAVDTHGNHQCEQRTRRVECHHVQFAVLAGRVGGWPDNAKCHLTVQRSLFRRRCPFGSFLPILVPHKWWGYGSLDGDLSEQDCPAVHSASLSLDQRHDALPHPFH